MIVEIALGDAYGSGFEFASREVIEEHNDLTHFIKHNRDEINAQYTDDTQMSIALVEHILGMKPRIPNIAIANSFVETFKRDPRKGYARKFQEFLETIKDGRDFLDNIQPNSIRNGAMMRSVPLCLIVGEQEMLDFALVQASITHCTYWGILSSMIIGYLSYHTLRGMPFDVIVDNLEKYYKFKPNFEWNDRVPCDAEATLHAVFAVLKSSRTYSDVLLRSVSFGGDTDSVAAIAMGIMSLTRPPVMETELKDLCLKMENGEYGLDYLIQLDSTIKKQMQIIRNSVN